MKLRRFAGSLLVLIPLLSGCSGFWDATSSSGGSGCTSNCSTSSSGAFYVLDAGTTPEIVGGTIVSGKYTNITGSPWTLPSTPFAMSMDSTGSFLYVSTIAGVFVYPVSSGVLGTAAQVSQDVAALAIQVDTTGTWLIEALQATGGVTLAAVPLNPATGGDAGQELTATYPISTAAVQNGKIAVSPDDKYVFVSLGAGGTIGVPFNAAAGSGVNPFAASATSIPISNASGSALSVAVDPGGHLLYIGESLANSGGTSGGLRVFNYSSLGTASLTQASGSPINSGGLAPNAIYPAASGNLVYVANGQGTGQAGNIASFSITSSNSTYKVAAVGSGVAAGNQPFALAVDSSSTYLFSVNSLGNPYFNSYTFDATTSGKLDPQITVNTGGSPLAIVAAP